MTPISSAETIATASAAGTHPTAYATQPAAEAPETEPTTVVQAVDPPVAYEACDQCGAPVDADQRYCVVCGTRRRHVYDPAVQFLSGATSRARAAAAPVRSSRSRQRRSFGLGTAAVLAVIPLAVAVGVLVGHGANSPDQKLLAALRAEKATVVNVGAADATTAAASAATTSPASTSVPTQLRSDFSLARGYTVQLQTLAAGATQTTVTGDERAARANGATAVGLISQSDFRVTPSPPAGGYVIYSGQYRTKSAADAALVKLAHKFPGAQVIAIQSSSSSSSNAAAGAGAGAGKVVASGSSGPAQAVTGFKPTTSQVAAGGQIVNKISKETNGSYVNGQNGLPDAISVP